MSGSSSQNLARLLERNERLLQGQPRVEKSLHQLHQQSEAYLQTLANPSAGGLDLLSSRSGGQSRPNSNGLKGGSSVTNSSNVKVLGSSSSSDNPGYGNTGATGATNLSHTALNTHTARRLLRNPRVETLERSLNQLQFSAAQQLVGGGGNRNMNSGDISMDGNGGRGDGDSTIDTAAAAAAGSITDSSSLALGRAPTMTQNLRSTMQTTIEEAQRQVFFQANYRCSQKQRRDWDSIRAGIVAQLDAGGGDDIRAVRKFAFNNCAMGGSSSGGMSTVTNSFNQMALKPEWVQRETEIGNCLAQISANLGTPTVGLAQQRTSLLNSTTSNFNAGVPSQGGLGLSSESDAQQQGPADSSNANTNYPTSNHYPSETVYDAMMENYARVAELSMDRVSQGLAREARDDAQDIWELVLVLVGWQRHLDLTSLSNMEEDSDFTITVNNNSDSTSSKSLHRKQMTLLRCVLRYWRDSFFKECYLGPGGLGGQVAAPRLPHLAGDSASGNLNQSSGGIRGFLGSVLGSTFSGTGGQSQSGPGSDGANLLNANFGSTANNRPKSIKDMRWSELLRLGSRQFGDPSFPSANAHIWFLVFTALRLQRVDLLQEPLENDDSLRELLGGEVQHFNALLSHLLRLQSPSLDSQNPDDNPAQDPSLLPLRDNLYNPAFFGTGGIYREMVLCLALGRPFPAFLEHHNADVHYARVSQADTMGWYGNIQCLSGRMSLKTYRQQMQQIPRAFNLRSALPFLFASLQFGKGLRYLGDQAQSMGGSGPANSSSMRVIGGNTSSDNVPRNPNLGTLSNGSSSPQSTIVALQMHLAAVLAIEDILQTEPLPFDFVGALVDFSGGLFDLPGQLRYLKLLPSNSGRNERKEALVQILHRLNFSEEVVGVIRDDGSHECGPLEECFIECDAGRGEGSDDASSEFVTLMGGSGRRAMRRGHYVEALRMLHLGERYLDVLLCLQRILRLPLWENEDSSSVVVQRLECEVARFVRIYQQNYVVNNCSLDSPPGSMQDAMSDSVGGAVNHRASSGLAGKLSFSQALSATPNAGAHLRQVLRLTHLRTFYRSLKAQKLEDALNIFDENRFLASEDGTEGLGMSGPLSSSDPAAGAAYVTLGNPYPLDHTRILESYLELLLKMKNATPRVRELRAFLSSRAGEHVLVSCLAHSRLAQLAERG